MPNALTLKKILSHLDELKELKKNDLLILDVGGGVNPFFIATHIIDICSYDEYINAYKQTKRYSPTASIGGKGEIKVKPGNWIVRDFSKHEEWPFPDKYFDFCICNHTLEDIMDPFFVLGQISRVSKEGYIGTPSKMWELTRGNEGRYRSRGFAGHSHHRWLFTLDHDTILIERKWHFIHGSLRWSFPPSWRKIWLTKGLEDMSVFWKSDLKFKELSYQDQNELDNEFENFILRYRRFNIVSLSNKLLKLVRKFLKL